MIQRRRTPFPCRVHVYMLVTPLVHFLLYGRYLCLRPCGKNGGEGGGGGEREREGGREGGEGGRGRGREGGMEKVNKQINEMLLPKYLQTCANKRSNISKTVSLQTKQSQDTK